MKLSDELKQSEAVPVTVGMITEFIYSRRIGTGLSNWSAGQILTYVLDQVKNGYMAIVDDGQGNIHAVVCYDPEFEGGFYVDQIWASSKLAVQDLVKILKKQFPNVNVVLGWRTNRLVEFNVKTLEKIYGR